MKLMYITTARIPTEKANGVQIVKMCEAFQRQGLAVELWLPRRVQSEAMRQVTDLGSYYDVETPFQVNYIGTPDFLPLESKLPHALLRGLYYFQYLLFSILAVLRTYTEPHAIYYTRSVQTLFVLAATRWLHRKPIYFEAHELHGNPDSRGLLRLVLTFCMRWMLSRIAGLVVITHRLKVLYAELGFPERLILVAPDGIETKRISYDLDRIEARKALHIPLDKTLVVYTGHLFTWKGGYVLAESGRHLPMNYCIYLVGGTEPDQRALQEYVMEQQLGNVVLTGHVPYREVPRYLMAADVLVLPNTSERRISREYTSPLKLFEYMGARRPIVASDLPSIREILCHEEQALLVPPDDPAQLAEGILRVTQDADLAQRLVNHAYAQVRDYTWENRAAKIVDFVTSK